MHERWEVPLTLFGVTVYERWEPEVPTVTLFLRSSLSRQRRLRVF
jgi:hypothetical protein